MNKSITGQVQVDEISGSVVADSVERNATKKAIVFLNHCDYAFLGCSGIVAGRGCDSVFVIREIYTEYRSRWFEGEEVEA